MKVCSRCIKERIIWKSVGKDKYCQSCWFQIKPAKKVNKISTKRKKQNNEYTQVRVDFLSKYEFCKARLPICTQWASEIHHMKGRIEELITDTSFFLPVCRSCHNWIENHPEESYILGLSLHRLQNNVS